MHNLKHLLLTLIWHNLTTLIVFYLLTLLLNQPFRWWIPLAVTTAYDVVGYGMRKKEI